LNEFIRSKKQTFFHYNGSLTTPGCDEIVTWMVLTEPVSCSTGQINMLKGLLKNNYRITMPVNERLIYIASDFSVGSYTKVTYWLLALVLLFLVTIV